MVHATGYISPLRQNKGLGGQEMKIVLTFSLVITFAAFLVSQQTISTLHSALKSYQEVVVNLPIECRIPKETEE